MDQEKIGNLLKKIRKENKLTQLEFANKLGVTPQAVSKWENGKNIPDISVLKEIKKLYNIDLDSILDGENSKGKNKLNYIIIIFLIVLIICLLIIIFLPKNKDDFSFKKIGTTCSDFNINGTVAYNKNKTAIHISDIEYCGELNNEVYDKIECSLYELYKDTSTKIESCEVKENIKLTDYLKTIDIKLEHYSSTCKMFKDSDMYLLINATNKKGVTTSYEIPIKLNSDC